MESDLVNDVVEDVLEKLYRKYPFEVNKELVGIEKKYEKMESLLRIGSNEVRTLVLWGMGGIGKTTLAKHLYAKLCSQFEHHCFIENIREESTPVFKNKLAHERSLIVLDDVTTLEQAENVNKYLGQGSRVIITTRDRQICNLLDNCEIYDFEEMNADESLQLFCLNAFEEKCPKDGYDNLSKKAILYCRGNPLALKVLGANFRKKKSKKGWESELEKLKKIPNRKIYDVLKLSYDDLDRTQQDIFLDIACISGIHYDSLTQIDYLTAVWNSCKFYAESGLEVLLDKALVYFDSKGLIAMHDLLKQMGKEIVMTESVKDPGRRSRLWDQNDVYDVLKYNKGTEAVEVIEFYMWNCGDLYLSSDCFKSMTNLRHLHITTNDEERLHLLDGLDWLSDKLRYLYWPSFPSESLPSTFCAEWLVQLNMECSKLKKLWDGIQRLDNLMILNLSYSKDLIETPDLSKAPNLQVVYLSYCESLCQLHPSIFSIPKLTKLKLKGCKKIEGLTNNIHLKSLQILDLSFSSALELSLWGAVVQGFYSLMSYNKKLTGLHLTECTQINTSSLWFILDGTPSLKELYLSNCCNLEILPNNIQNNSMLKILYLDECSKLKFIPKLPASLQKLELNECRKLKSLPKLPVSLQYLNAKNCIHLDTISIQRSILENISLSIRNLPTDPWEFFFPGAEVPSEFYFHTAEAIIIPPIPKYGLCGFIICIILSEEAGLLFACSIFCTIYQHTEEIDRHRILCSTGLISDHVLVNYISCDNSYWVKAGSESGGDDYNLSFKFSYKEVRDMRTDQWIKSCGVIPVYDLKHSFVSEDGRNSGVKIVEIQSNTQLSDDSDDINEIQSNAQLSDDSDEIVEIQFNTQLSDDI